MRKPDVAPPADKTPTCPPKPNYRNLAAKVSALLGREVGPGYISHVDKGWMVSSKIKEAIRQVREQEANAA